MKSRLSASDKIFIDQSDIDNAGRGVFASTDIGADETIEVTLMLVIDSAFMAWVLRLTPLRNYFFQWGTNRRKAAIALGFGSLYNHSFEPNAVYEKNIEKGVIEFSARQDIQKGEEITINYNGHPEDMRVLWDDTIGDPDEPA
jgi:hypothetical protein